MKALSIFRDYGSIDISYIEVFEDSVGKKFPATYKSLISKHNGAYFNEDTFNFITLNGPNERSCAFLAYGDVNGDLIAEYQLDDVECGLFGLVSFARDGGGDYICFDYRANPTTDNPPVVVVFHDWWEEGADGVRRMLVCDVAKDFEAFVDLLYEDKDED